MKESSSILKELTGSEAGRLSRASLGVAAVLQSPKVPQNRHRVYGSGAGGSPLTGVVIRGYFLPFTGPKEKESTYKNTLLAAVHSKWLTVLSVLTCEVCQQRD